jgi:NadR type nicotinamide-nucleotide adenylyltransferase
MEKRTEKVSAVRRIAVTGPESTGKSVLSEQLAEHYHTSWVPEYSRVYLEQLGKPYSYDDILKIAQGQSALEESLAGKANKYLFCDTEFIVTRIWSIFKYQTCDPWIDRQIDEHRYDLYLLCDIDLPWEYDPLREHPGHRNELFSLYKHELESRGLPYHIVSGTGSKRITKAISFIERINK